MAYQDHGYRIPTQDLAASVKALVKNSHNTHQGGRMAEFAAILCTVPFRSSYSVRSSAHDFALAANISVVRDAVLHRLSNQMQSQTLFFDIHSAILIQLPSSTFPFLKSVTFT